MKIEKNKLVMFNYILKDKNNNVIESTIGEEPITYIHGTGVILPKLEEELENREKGEEIIVEVSAQEGYGDVLDDLVQTAPIEEFQDLEMIEIGQIFQIQMETEEGLQTTMAKITEFTDDDVTFDMNHPLAGQDLKFEITINEVREPSPEELDSQPS